MENFSNEAIKLINMTNAIPPAGQLSDNERNFLTQIVIDSKPEKILESGTWKGGGSTLALTKGLFYNKAGILDSYEEHKEFFDIAKLYYDYSEFVSFVNLHHGSFLPKIKNLPEHYYNNLDIIFLDGGDEQPNGFHKFPVNEYIKDYNISENVQSFMYLATKIKPNTKVLLHDWSIDMGRGHFIKRYLEDTNFNGFELKTVITGSTGLAFLIKT